MLMAVLVMLPWMLCAVAAFKVAFLSGMGGAALLFAVDWFKGQEELGCWSSKFYRFF